MLTFLNDFIHVDLLILELSGEEFEAKKMLEGILDAVHPHLESLHRWRRPVWLAYSGEEAEKPVRDLLLRRGDFTSNCRIIPQSKLPALLDEHVMSL